VGDRRRVSAEKEGRVFALSQIGRLEKLFSFTKEKSL